jgi:STE24 endopeptidase
VRWRVAVGAVLAVAWAFAAWFLWRSSVPSFDLPKLNAHAVFPVHVLDRATHYSRGMRLLWLGSTVAKIAALAVFAKYGIRWRRESAAGPIGTGMLLGMLGFALVWAAQLPFDVLEVWWRHRYGQSGSYLDATVGTWAVLGTEFVFLCASLGIVMGFARVRRIGDAWWLFAAPVFIGLTILFAFISPWLLGGRPYHADVRKLERIEHVRHVPVRVLDGFDEPNAFATGLGASRRVFLWAPILESPFTAREDRFVLAHELGHLAHDHIWRSVGWYALFAFPGTFLLARAARRRGGMRTPEAVPLAILVLVVLQLVQLPVQNAVTRHLEAEADWSALKATDDPAGGRKLFEQFASVTLEDPNPPWWDYVMLENHPTLLQRIEMARYYATSAAQSP